MQNSTSDQATINHRASCKFGTGHELTVTSLELDGKKYVVMSMHGQSLTMLLQEYLLLPSILPSLIPVSFRTSSEKSKARPPLLIFDDLQDGLSRDGPTGQSKK